MKCILPQTPLLYSKTGVCMGIPIFHIFDPKHSLWVLVRTTSMYVLSEKIKIIENFQMKFSILTSEKNCMYTTWANFRNVMFYRHSFCSLFVSHFDFHCVISILIHI